MMPSKKVKKQVDRFKAGIYKFVEHFSLIVGAEEIDRKEISREGNTSVIVKLKPTKDGLSATRAAKIGAKMAAHFPAWFCPTHYEMYTSFSVTYKRGEGMILVEGKI